MERRDEVVFVGHLIGQLLIGCADDCGCAGDSDYFDDDDYGDYDYDDYYCDDDGDGGLMKMMAKLNLANKLLSGASLSFLLQFHGILLQTDYDLFLIL